MFDTIMDFFRSLFGMEKPGAAKPEPVKPAESRMRQNVAAKPDAKPAPKSESKPDAEPAKDMRKKALTPGPVAIEYDSAKDSQATKGGRASGVYVYLDALRAAKEFGMGRNADAAAKQAAGVTAYVAASLTAHPFETKKGKTTVPKGIDVWYFKPGTDLTDFKPGRGKKVVATLDDGKALFDERKAGAAYFGVSDATFAKWLNGKAKPKPAAGIKKLELVDTVRRTEYKA